MNKDFWKNRKVFITGHTGFKGTWLTLWLHFLGAEVTGYALRPPTEPNMFELCRGRDLIKSILADIRDGERLMRELRDAKPEVVIHMAAQPLVRESYKIPTETYAVNVMGTVNILEAVRHSPGVKAIVNVTTDKCYENKEWVWGYRENDVLGGYDPYSNSKACAELVTSSYRNSFFHPDKYASHGVALASARAGNVIGGGDWALDRLVPDAIRALTRGEKVRIRNPWAIRPWQHVLEPLRGYLMLAENLYVHGHFYAEGWNFGPEDDDAKPVEWIIEKLCSKFNMPNWYEIDGGGHPHEAYYLKLDCSKAKGRLNWQPRWNLDLALDRIVDWSRAYRAADDMQQFTLRQIQEYTAESR